MDRMELLLSLTTEERLDMSLKGFKAFDANDVKRYRSGQRLSLKERTERIQTLTGGEITNMGAASDREVTLDTSKGPIPIADVEKQITKRPQDFRQALNEDMNNYADRTIGTDDLMSLKKPQQQQQKPAQTNSIETLGYSNTKNYLNAFVLNLQNEEMSQSYQLRLNIFKALKKCLEDEGKYKENPKAMQTYRQGVMRAEQNFYNKLTNG
jgi:hypothetical protein